MLKTPQVYILGRSPLKGFYYTKGARGKWHTASRVTSGTKWNHYLCSGKAIPKGTKPEIFRAPPAVRGILSSMMTAREREYEAEKITLHEHHAPSAIHLEVRQHTIHASHSSGTGWVDVPMPGMQTQYQQAGFVQMGSAPGRHTGTHNSAPQKPQVPIAVISLQALAQIVPARAQTTEAGSFTADFVHQPAAKGAPKAKAHETRAPETIALAPVPKGETRTEEAPRTITIAKSRQVHFSAPRISSPEKPKAEKARAPNPKTNSSAPLPGFKVETPRSERIILSSEISIQAMAPPPEYSAGPVRAGEITLPAHIGYIPSVKKKEKQLKVTQGAEGIPPQ